MIARKKCPKVFVSTAPFGEVDPSVLISLEQSGLFFKVNALKRKLTGEEVLENALDCTAVIAGTEDLSRLVEESGSLELIARVGVGLDNLDVDAAHDLDIQGGWTGGINKRSVSEQALAFML